MNKTYLRGVCFYQDTQRKTNQSGKGQQFLRLAQAYFI